MIYTADFETTTNKDDCRVWLWGLCTVDSNLEFNYGTDIDSFMAHLSQKENNTYYFHNLKFDMQFILCWLFENGYEHVTKRKYLDTKTFTTLISDKGIFYSIEICFESKGKTKNKSIIYDSMKLFNMSVSDVAKGFKLPIQKGEIEYDKPRKKGYTPDSNEISYQRNDVEIMARALLFLFEQGYEKMTIGSNALHSYKNLIGSRKFEYLFPVPDYDAGIRKCYKGGFTYLSKKYRGKYVKRGLVFDVNSLYPSVMRFERYPIGNPVVFKGQYEHDETYDLYIQVLSCSFELKKNHIPCLQIKGNRSFIETEYLETSNGEEVTLTLTSVDLEMLFKHYDVYNVSYWGGYKFRSKEGIFNEYIDYWSEEKIKAKNEKNHAMYILAKLFLNSLYGKFATSPLVCSKYPFYDNGVVKYAIGEEETKDPVYLPVGAFITAYARRKTISTAQQIEDNYHAGKSKVRFVYADTDSLHLDSPDGEIPSYIDVDDTKLGAWKLEFIFTKGKYLRAKCYMEYGYEPPKEGEEIKEELKVCCAGMPDNVKEQVTFKNFRYGKEFYGKLAPKNVRGGVVLVPSTFTIKHDKKK